ncbi:hypothetical protein DBR39_16115 [Chryseobacterium sp. KBW03]|jgi:hypothetical protein|uniref:hypothetical protein n=1 Tax=Chryseobacterium sp. KBW03 TaxID=2153362 RepID=UPI000F5AD9CE|nr:hypothetical protein [Chryseobacterium sp. KBW03]RQO36614.1 hypothetical protein DBR39_16115 [Chryseobacterium sp. KBW03]
MKFSLLLPLLGISLLTLSCSGNDDTLPNTEQEPTTPVQPKTTHFNPPTWIQGTWSWKQTSVAPIQRIKFTQNDIILPNNVSYNDLINQSKTKTLVLAIESEGSSSTMYAYTETRRPTTSSAYSADEFRVKKINDTLMVRYPEFSPAIYYTKE